MRFLVFILLLAGVAYGGYRYGKWEAAEEIAKEQEAKQVEQARTAADTEPDWFEERRSTRKGGSALDAGSKPLTPRPTPGGIPRTRP